MPAQWIRPTGLRIAGPYSSRVPGPAIATGQPRVQISCDQLVSKYSLRVGRLGAEVLLEVGEHGRPALRRWTSA